MPALSRRVGVPSGGGAVGRDINELPLGYINMMCAKFHMYVRAVCDDGLFVVDLSCVARHPGPRGPPSER